MTTITIPNNAKNRINPLENITFTPCPDKLSNIVEVTNKYKKDGSPKIKRRYSPLTVKVYGDLIRRTRGRRNSRVFPKIETIAEKLNCSYGSVQRALCKLENDLIIFRRYTGRSSFYYFVPLKDDGTPDENSGEYQTAEALLAQKKGQSDLAKRQLTNNSNETKIPTRDFLSPAEKQRAAKRAALLSMVPKELKISLAVLKLWINVALKYFADDAQKVFDLTFQSDNPRVYFWKVYKTKILDIKKRQSLTKPPSIQNLPPNPPKDLVIKEKKIDVSQDKLDLLIDSLDEDQKQKIFVSLYNQSTDKKKKLLKSLEIDEAIRLDSVRYKVQKMLDIEFEK